jgi:5-methylcytosine-specific restriction enzyme subunit McrC
MTESLRDETIPIDEDTDNELQSQLSDEDVAALEENDDLSVSLDSSGTVTINSGRKIGLVGLPSGTVLEIEPKVDFNLLYYLAYAGRIDDEMVRGYEAGISTGNSFVDLIGHLFATELDRILRRGLHQEYRTKQEMEKFIRGRLDVTRQISSQGLLSTEFACEYDDLTYDLPINHVLVSAIDAIQPLVTNTRLESKLRRGRGRLRQYFKTAPRGLIDPRDISLTRQTTHYEAILTLCELILDERYVDDLGAGLRNFQSILLSTNELFEHVVFRAVENAIDTDVYSIEGDGDPRSSSSNNIGYLLESVSGSGSLQRLEPDVYLSEKATDDVVMIGDAKWKEPNPPRPSHNDLYQMTAYQAKVDAPVLLVYPPQDGKVEEEYRYLRDHKADSELFHTLELDTQGTSTYDGFSLRVQNQVKTALRKILW